MLWGPCVLLAMMCNFLNSKILSTRDQKIKVLSPTMYWMLDFIEKIVQLAGYIFHFQVQFSFEESGHLLSGCRGKPHIHTFNSSYSLHVCGAQTIPASPKKAGEHTVSTSVLVHRSISKTVISKKNDDATWVYTVETTLVDTLKIVFPPSTHFMSAPFCQMDKIRKYHHQCSSCQILPHFSPAHLGVAGFFDSKVSRRQVTRDRDVELLRWQATFFEERQPRVPHYKTHKHRSCKL